MPIEDEEDELFDADDDEDDIDYDEKENDEDDNEENKTFRDIFNEFNQILIPLLKSFGKQKNGLWDIILPIKGIVDKFKRVIRGKIKKNDSIDDLVNNVIVGLPLVIKYFKNQ